MVPTCSGIDEAQQKAFVCVTKYYEYLNFVDVSDRRPRSDFGEKAACYKRPDSFGHTTFYFPYFPTVLSFHKTGNMLVYRKVEPTFNETRILHRVRSDLYRIQSPLKSSYVVRKEMLSVRNTSRVEKVVLMGRL